MLIMLLLRANITTRANGAGKQKTYCTSSVNILHIQSVVTFGNLADMLINSVCHSFVKKTESETGLAKSKLIERSVRRKKNAGN